jgi:hypothetical protein
MTYRAKMENGQVVFEGGIKPADGVELRVDEVVTEKEDAVAPPAEGTTLGQRLMKLSGIVEGLPPDAARNHDHYLYGTPKRKR